VDFQVLSRRKWLSKIYYCIGLYTCITYVTESVTFKQLSLFIFYDNDDTFFFCPAVKFINNTARIGFRTPNDFKKISRNVNRNVHRRRLNSVEAHMDKGDGRQVR